jgi:hypothetical protein
VEDSFPEHKKVEDVWRTVSLNTRRLRMCGGHLSLNLWSTLVLEQKEVEDVWRTLVP